MAGKLTAWEQDLARRPAGSPAAASGPVAERDSGQTGPDTTTHPGVPVRPPLGGPGSSRRDWATYATALGFDVDPDATRDEIVAMIDDQDS